MILGTLQKGLVLLIGGAGCLKKTGSLRLLQPYRLGLMQALVSLGFPPWATCIQTGEEVIALPFKSNVLAREVTEMNFQ